MNRLGLRARLVAVVLILLTAGLVVSDVVTATAVRSYLLQRVDDTLDAVVPISVFRLSSPSVAPPPLPAGSALPAPTNAFREVFAARLDRDGRVVDELVGPFSSSKPSYSGIDRAAVHATSGGAGQRRFSQRFDGESYRIAIAPINGSSDVIAVLVPLRDVQATLSRLRKIEYIVTAALLVVAIVSSWLLVRLGLRPLRQMADDADAIAAGEHGRRIDAHGGPEVARLGAALNGAFEARQTIEDRLRTFVSDASHELRTPITAIRGYAELLRTGAVDGVDADAAVQRIESEAARMGGLVEDLLLLARLDERRRRVVGPVELTVLAADAAADSMAADTAHPVTVVAPDALVVEGDEPALRQVFANLLANVRAHTPPGTSVEVAVEQVEGMARIDVVDTGPGIPEDAAHRVFDRFWRVDAAHHRVDDGGSGLGLAIVQAVAEDHAGTASVVPGGGGAHIRVVLPLRQPV